MLRAGIMFMPSGKIFLSTAHSESDVDQTADALAKLLSRI
jgi:glutamate-1-semialdehyde 2,1-aminomutase